MASPGNEERAERAPSLRKLAFVSAVVVGILAIVIAAVFSWTAAVLDRSISNVVRDARSQAIANELELALLSYQRISNLRVLTGEEALDTTRAEIAAAMDRLYVEAEEYIGDADEERQLRLVSQQLAEYRQERAMLEARGLDLEEISLLTQPRLNAAVAALDELRALNDAQVLRAHGAAQRGARLAGLAGAGLGLVLVIGLVIVGFGVRQYLLRPMLAFHGAMARLRSGDGDARLREGGFREVAELAQGFNDMADTLARRSEDQLTFLAGVAHDLRNPLSALKLGIHSLELGPQSEASRGRTLTRLDRQVDRLARMVEDLLDATRIEAGQLELRLEDLDVRDVVDDMVRLYAPTSPDHDITATAPAEPVVVRGDPLRLEQVVSNLLSNAVKFSPRGGPVSITVAAESDAAVIAVADRGVGIPPEDVANIFLPFRRHRPQVAAGAGLGLSVVRRIVTAHGGRIEVESKPGAGSTFRVHIPLAKAGRVESTVAA